MPSIFFQLAVIFCTFLTNSASASIWSDPLLSQNKMPAQRQENCSVNSGEILDLAGAIDIALCNNIDTKIAWFNAKSSAALLGKARGEYLPQITIGVKEQKIDNDNAKATGNNAANSTVPNATLNYLLFDFGGREARIETAKQQMLAAGFDYNNTMQSILFQVVKNYAQVLIAQESLNSAQKAQAASQEILDAARIKMTIGTATKADEAQADTANSQSILDTQTAENNLRIAQGSFAVLLHLPPSKTIKLQEIDFREFSKPLDQNIDELLAKAIEQRPDVRAIKARELETKADLKQAKTVNYPSISAFGSKERNLYHDDNISDYSNTTLGVQVTMPFFSGFSDYYQIISAQNAYKSAQNQQLKIEDAAALDVWTSYNNYQTARGSYTTAQTLLRSAQLSEELTLGRYKVGKGSLIDALNAQAQSAKARFIEVQAKNNLLITKFDLDRSLGDVR